MKKLVLKTLLFTLGGFLTAVLLFFAVLYISFTPECYQTSDLSEYGNYIGNNNDDAPDIFINSFFPKKIEHYFSDITYEYRAQTGDAYAFEAYLEFAIKDAELFNSFVATYTDGMKGDPFPYDPQFTQYVVEDVLDVSTFEQEKNEVYSIGYAKIGKILCLPEEQKIIFVAMGVYDGGIAQTDFLTVYFNRFNIDPMEYEHNIPHKPRVPIC